MSLDLEKSAFQAVLWSRTDWGGELNKANGTGKARVGEDAVVGLNAAHAKVRRGEEVEDFQCQVLDSGQAIAPTAQADTGAKTMRTTSTPMPFKQRMLF
jgi:hypothetical protein